MHRSRQRLPGELAFVGLLLIFALLVLFLAYRISGFSGASSAGVFPMLAGLTMVGSAAAILLRTLRMRPAPDGGGVLRAFFARITPTEIAVYGLIVIAFMLALEPLGFVIAALLFLLISFLYLERGRIVRAVLVSVGAVALILLIFRHVFKVILPEGPWP